ncbi:MAG: DNA polymerase, partial [Pseudomonadota bacterium]
ILLDVSVLRTLGERIGRECHALEQQIQAIAGYPINLLSPKQLGDFLFERLGLRSDRMRRTKLGYSTDHEQLEELVDAHPVVRLVLEHRELVKLKTTYIDALPPLLNPHTGRLHTSYSQVATVTGRLASMNPNIQNIPVRTALGREIRRAFVAEPGHVLVSADYSQIELRVLAHFSEDPVLLDAFARDLDVHAQTAAEVFGVALEDVSAEQRRIAKAVNYGLGYGQTDFGLARTLDIRRDEARRYIDRYFTRFARVNEFMEGVIARARQDSQLTTILGRRLPTPGIAGARQPVRAAAERAARNAPIQGSAADILKLAMIRMQKLLDNGDWRARMLLSVHDELVFEVAEVEARSFAERVREEMERAYDLRAPLKVDVGIAPTWAEAH